MFDHHPFGPVADRNLLFGVLALRSDFIDRDALIGAMNTWAEDRTRSLGEILSEQGTLSVEREILVEAMIEERLHTPIVDQADRLTGDENHSVSRNPSGGSRIPGADIEPDQPTTNGSPRTPKGRKFHSEGSRYRVLRPHAKGGLGEVFIAEDLELPRQVALKEIQREHVGDMSFRARFVQEAEITGGLEHPGIVPIYSLGAYPDGRPFYAMRLVNGVSLRDAIDGFHQADTPDRDLVERSIGLRQLLRHSWTSVTQLDTPIAAASSTAI